MTRREWLGSGVLAAIPNAEVRREVFVKAPGKGTAVMAYAWDADKTGRQMIAMEQRWSRSDTVDAAFVRQSSDWGKTWSEPERRTTGEKRAAGMWRQHPRGWWFDQQKGKLLEFWTEGTLPNDDPLEGMRQWKIFYRLDGQVYSVAVPGVIPGKNSAMLGDQTCRPLPVKGGFLLPVQISPLDADGNLYNPGGGYTYHDAAVLHATWKGDQLDWRLSQLLKGDPARSTRGLPEGTLGHLRGGRILMVMRGSNDRKTELPSHRWYSISDDGGWKWGEAKPWTYDDGQAFFSPSACSQLLEHSSGKLFWLGNITPGNPKGNRPRYPFVIGEVSRDRGLLIRSSVRVVDDLQAGENPLLTLSNFYAREDRKSGETCLHMTRLLALSDGWKGDALLYRIRP